MLPLQILVVSPRRSRRRLTLVRQDTFSLEQEQRRRKTTVTRCRTLSTLSKLSTLYLHYLHYLQTVYKLSTLYMYTLYHRSKSSYGIKAILERAESMSSLSGPVKGGRTALYTVTTDG